MVLIPFLTFFFHLLASGTQLAPVIRHYYATEQLRTCSACGTVDLPALQNPDYGDSDVPAQYGKHLFDLLFSTSFHLDMHRSGLSACDIFKLSFLISRCGAAPGRS